MKDDNDERPRKIIQRKKTALCVACLLPLRIYFFHDFFFWLLLLALAISLAINVCDDQI